MAVIKNVKAVINVPLSPLRPVVSTIAAARELSSHCLKTLTQIWSAVLVFVGGTVESS